MNKKTKTEHDIIVKNSTTQTDNVTKLSTMKSKDNFSVYIMFHEEIRKKQLEIRCILVIYLHKHNRYNILMIA